MHEYIERLQTPRDRMLHLWFEPWAEGLAFPPETSVELRAESTLPGKLELDETPERTAVYGWAGSTLRVFTDGQLVQSFDQAVPEILARLSTKEGISMLFGEPPTPTPAEGAGWRKRPWWRLWK
ncbi:hypothetical protein [Pelomonas sp. KK5]|uniref:hypothetical protein n=1 Tax=Pelomonas sp. KK5 TaxID=1855730 RepID=UPI00117E0B38|nr:hypothetical protein [Pelomonas sp. KK5]